MKLKLPATILKKIAALLDSKQADDIVALNVKKISDICDYILICSGKNKFHLDALEQYVSEFLDKYNIEILGREGSSMAGWIVIDIGFVLIHIFLPELREYYNLLRLWGDAKKVEIL